MKKNLLKERLEQFKKTKNKDSNSCLHDSCDSCKGTGVKMDGFKCIHYISCKCNKCSPRY